ncbi:hypothetical protein FALBO_12421 [Fusarium albosuccineum]|uniref:Uncharacterized protein n=1 Tax=Fusarium albosuccineum TaxID=1237068 RepID=A0A8H4L0Q5_9HYPO|nr:hypothetical protein FALBO_12421 [Fusarium albosuccineum]
MSSRVSKKPPKSSSESAKQRKLRLLETILCHSIEMAPCSACAKKGLTSCQASPHDSSRCSECVRLNLVRCDVEVSPAQLRNIATQHQKLEEELERAEERVLSLRKQKKLWFEKMIRAVSRGIDSVEELERVEREEAEREADRQRQAAVSQTPAGRSSTEDLVLEGFDERWAECFGDASLEPALMEDFSAAALSYCGVSGGSSSEVAGRS